MHILEISLIKLLMSNRYKEAFRHTQMAQTVHLTACASSFAYDHLFYWVISRYSDLYCFAELSQETSLAISR